MGGNVIGMYENVYMHPYPSETESCSFFLAYTFEGIKDMITFYCKSIASLKDYIWHNKWCDNIDLGLEGMLFSIRKYYVPSIRKYSLVYFNEVRSWILCLLVWYFLPKERNIQNIMLILLVTFINLLDGDKWRIESPVKHVEEFHRILVINKTF